MYYNDISRAETSRKNIKLIAYRIVAISESATFSVVDYWLKGVNGLEVEAHVPCYPVFECPFEDLSWLRSSAEGYKTLLKKSSMYAAPSVTLGETWKFTTALLGIAKIL